MRKTVIGLVALCTLTACTPQEIAVHVWMNRDTGTECRAWVGATRLAGFPERVVPTMQRIMRRESNCLPWAYRPGYKNNDGRPDFGLFQVHESWIPSLIRAGIITSASDLFNPQLNARAAFYIYQTQGLGAWNATCC